MLLQQPHAPYEFSLLAPERLSAISCPLNQVLRCVKVATMTYDDGQTTPCDQFFLADHFSTNSEAPR